MWLKANGPGKHTLQRGNYQNTFEYESDIVHPVETKLYFLINIADIKRKIVSNV